MAATDIQIAEATQPSAARRMLAFVGRAALAASVAWASLYLVEHQGRLIREESLLRYPLAVALDQSGIAVYESEIVATAKLRAGAAPSFAELKEAAVRVAGQLPQEGTESLWADASDGFSVVYVEGSEPFGGRWIASARWVQGAEPGSGTVETAVHRQFHGMPEEMPRIYHATLQLLARGAGVAARREGKAVFRGRPAREAPRVEIAASILAAAGADLRYEEVRDDRYVAAGWTPRLPGRVELGRRAVNVVVTVTRHGLGEWVEVETPIL